MKLNIELEGKSEIERLILIINIGLIDALKEKLISIEQAEKILYSPYTASQLQKLNVSEKIIDIIHLGWELEDVESLIPDKLDESFEEIRLRSIELLKSMNGKNRNVKRTDVIEKVKYESERFER